LSSTPQSGYESVDHPADLRLRVWAPDREHLFLEAAAALIETLFPDGKPAGAPAGELEIVLDGVDPDDLLVRWLGELHFQAEARNLVPAETTFVELGRERLRARCRMTRAGRPGCEIKAVTYHQSGIREREGHLEAMLLFDV
jgi:SHS2 domain-containing protein